jgi:hypothetical protein
MKFCKSKGNKIALSVGLFLGGLHLVWALMVALIPQALQSFLNWIFQLHFLVPVWVLTPFNFVNALLLTIVTFAMGYLATLLFLCPWKIAKVK